MLKYHVLSPRMVGSGTPGTSRAAVDGSVATMTASQSIAPAEVSIRVVVTASARTPRKIRLRNPWAN